VLNPIAEWQLFFTSTKFVWNYDENIVKSYYCPFYECALYDCPSATADATDCTDLTTKEVTTDHTGKVTVH